MQARYKQLECFYGYLSYTPPNQMFGWIPMDFSRNTTFRASIFFKPKKTYFIAVLIEAARQSKPLCGSASFCLPMCSLGQLAPAALTWSGTRCTP